MDGPLEGLRILDLSQVQAGPSCTQLLAWLGAEVLKIEEPGVGDRTRTEMAHRPDMDSFYFLVFNANKKSVCLNLKTQEGQDLFKRLLLVSDVVIENFGPGRMAQFNLDYEQLKRVNPRILYASIKGFGNYGPYAEFKSFENIAQAMSGAMSTNGPEDGPPMVIAPGVGDSGSGLHCAIGILAALHRREKTGEGAQIEVSMQDAVVNLNRIRMIQTLASGDPLDRAGNKILGPQALVFPCRPGGPNDYVSLYMGGEAWDSLLAIMGRSDLIGDERYSTDEARAQRSGEIEKLVTEWTLEHTKHEIMATMNEVGIPCGAVLDTCEVLEDPHLRAREMVLELNDPDRGNYPVLGCPIKISSSRPTITPPPVLGRDSEGILAEILDLSVDEIAELRVKRVI